MYLEEVLPRLLVRGVLEPDGADDEGVGDGDDDDGDVVGARVQDAVAPRRSHACTESVVKYIYGSEVA